MAFCVDEQGVAVFCREEHEPAECFGHEYVMTNPTVAEMARRLEMMELIQRLWRAWASPSVMEEGMRLGQLITHAMGNPLANPDLYYTSDENLVSSVEDFARRV